MSTMRHDAWMAQDWVQDGIGEHFMDLEEAMKTALSADEAELIVEAHEIRQLMENEEERELLKLHNPSLLGAYVTLLEIAGGK